MSTLESLANIITTSGTRLAPPAAMKSASMASTAAPLPCQQSWYEQEGYDPETTLTLGPAERRQLLAEAFATEGTEQDATLRMTAPAVLAGIPSPIGDDDPPPSGERPTRPVPVPVLPRPAPIAKVLAFSAVAAGLVSALVVAALAQ